jgi:hypothetical protein
MSAAPSFRGSVPATLPQLLRSDCLHAPRPSARPSPNPRTRYSPARIRPQPAAPIIIQCTAGARKAPAHSAAGRRCAQRTAEVQRRQLRHSCETRCQRRCPSSSDPIPILSKVTACTHRRPSARYAKTPASGYSPARNRPSPHHATSSMHSRRSQALAHIASQADARSVPPRPSDVSCVILPRLGASDAAPSSPIRLPARTTAPRLAPRETHTTSYSPVRNPCSPHHATSSAHCRLSQASAHSAAGHRCTQRTMEVQRRQLHHPSQTRCQRRRPSCSEAIACTHRRHLRSDCLHALPPLGSPLAKPPPSAQPRTQPLQPTPRNVISAQPALASTRSQRSWPPMHAAYS